MNIQQAVGLSRMQERSPSYAVQEKRSAAAITARIFARAEEMGSRIMGVTEKQWQENELASETFYLITIPTHLASVPRAPQDSSKVLASMAASADSLEPIVVDVNKNKIGVMPNGTFYPPVIVVDGAHRHRGVVLQGRERISAWVGELAAAHLGLLDEAKPGVQKEVNAAAEEPKKKKQSKRVGPLEASMQLHACVKFEEVKKRLKATGMDGPGASLSDGSGANPDLKKMTADRDSGGYSGYQDATKTMSDKTKGASNSEMVKSGMLKGTGYQGFKKASVTQSDKTRGASGSELAGKLKGSALVKKLVTRYRKALKAGRYVHAAHELQAVAPPGMESTVKGLKKHFKKGSASPFKLAWYIHNKRKGK